MRNHHLVLNIHNINWILIWALAKNNGVDINSIFNTLQGYIGGIYAADFSRFGKQYRVYVQSRPSERSKVRI